MTSFRYHSLLVAHLPPTPPVSQLALDLDPNSILEEIGQELSGHLIDTQKRYPNIPTISVYYDTVSRYILCCILYLLKSA